MTKQSTHTVALLPAAGTDLVRQQRPTPTPKFNEILIRNHSIAVNPVDWKRQAWGFAIPQYPAALGNDVTGTIVEVGSSGKNFKIRDRVIGSADLFSSGLDDHAAFQAYTVVQTALTSLLPTAMSFEEGVLLPMGLTTAFIALFDNSNFSSPPSEYLRALR